MILTNDRSYIIIDSRELDLIDFSLFLESKDKVIYNFDRSKSIVKYTGSQPSYTFIYPIEGPYSVDEVSTIMIPPEWPWDDEVSIPVL